MGPLDVYKRQPQDCIVEVIALRDVGERVLRFGLDQLEAGLHSDLGAGHLEGKLVVILLGQLDVYKRQGCARRLSPASAETTPA